MTDAPPVTDNAEQHRFEVTLDGHLAELVYRRTGHHLDLLHTGVPDALEGHGIGGVLVEAAVDRAERDGLILIPTCSFAAGWLDRHPEVAGRVRIEAPSARD